MAWLFTGLTQGLGLGLAAVAMVGAAIAALWSLVGIYLGRWFERDDVELEVIARSATSGSHNKAQ